MLYQVHLVLMLHHKLKCVLRQQSSKLFIAWCTLLKRGNLTKIRLPTHKCAQYDTHIEFASKNWNYRRYFNEFYLDWKRRILVNFHKQRRVVKTERFFFQMIYPRIHIFLNSNLKPKSNKIIQTFWFIKWIEIPNFKKSLKNTFVIFLFVDKRSRWLWWRFRGSGGCSGGGSSHPLLVLSQLQFITIPLIFLAVASPVGRLLGFGNNHKLITFSC